MQSLGARPGSAASSRRSLLEQTSGASWNRASRSAKAWCGISSTNSRDDSPSATCMVYSRPRLVARKPPYRTITLRDGCGAASIDATSAPEEGSELQRTPAEEATSADDSLGMGSPVQVVDHG